jgi:glyoxylase-like metal-dependent hydrolase (beta-lactamase superfamily II)
MRRYAEGVLLAAWSRRAGARWLGRWDVDGRAADVISFADSDGAEVTLFFDGVTHLLLKQDVYRSSPITGDGTSTVAYDDWRVTGGLRLPYHIVDRTNDTLFQDLRVTTMRMDVAPPDDLLASPPWPAPTPPGPPTARPLANGVYAITSSYNSLLVVFDTFSVIVEAGNSEGATRLTLREAARVAPDQPVRFVVCTHFHHDHLGGIRGYIAQGVTVVAAPDAAQSVRQASISKQILFPDDLALRPRDPLIEIVTRERTFTEGSRTLRVIDVGPNPHAAEMLIAYVPGAAVLYEADMLNLTVPSGQTAPAGDDTRALLRAIERLQLDVQTIVPSHGRVGTLDDLRRAAREPAGAKGPRR